MRKIKTKEIIGKLELELNLFFFRIKKISEYANMYRKWWAFIGKRVRDEYHNAI